MTVQNTGKRIKIYPESKFFCSNILKQSFKETKKSYKVLLLSLKYIPLHLT